VNFYMVTVMETFIVNQYINVLNFKLRRTKRKRRELQAHLYHEKDLEIHQRNSS
jgi:hypothetical protein